MMPGELNAVVRGLYTLFQRPDCIADAGHGVGHALAVLRHVDQAITTATVHVPPAAATAVRRAALLHDADDRKVFLTASDAEPYANARAILEKAYPNEPSADHELCIRMISLVSCTGNANGNGDVSDDEPWMLWPRHADRLEALGAVGVHRCVGFTNHQGGVFALPTTPRVSTPEELAAVATPERLANYRKVGSSASALDHFYDKLLQIGRPEHFENTGTPYFAAEAAARHQVIVDFVCHFGRTGEVRMPLAPRGTVPVTPDRLE